MNPYWDWWTGAAALGALTIGHQLVLGRRLGVSGAWDRIVHWRREREVERLDAQFDEAAFEAAMAAAAAELLVAAPAVRVGATAVPPAPPAAAPVVAPVAAAGASPGSRRRSLLPAPPLVPVERPSVRCQSVFLTAMLVGGFLAAFTAGRFELRADMGPDFAAIVTDGPLLWPVLFIGGVLVGFGTRLAGGCSSGHGLSGCSRLQPVSVLATACFFAAASATSFVLWKVW